MPKLLGALKRSKPLRFGQADKKEEDDKEDTAIVWVYFQQRYSNVEIME